MYGGGWGGGWGETLYTLGLAVGSFDALLSVRLASSICKCTCSFLMSLCALYVSRKRRASHGRIWRRAPRRRIWGRIWRNGRASRGRLWRGWIRWRRLWAWTMLRAIRLEISSFSLAPPSKTTSVNPAGLFARFCFSQHHLFASSLRVHTSHANECFLIQPHCNVLS